MVEYMLTGSNTAVVTAPKTMPVVDIYNPLLYAIISPFEPGSSARTIVRSPPA